MVKRYAKVVQESGKERLSVQVVLAVPAADGAILLEGDEIGLHSSQLVLESEPARREFGLYIFQLGGLLLDAALQRGEDFGLTQSASTKPRMFSAYFSSHAPRLTSNGSDLCLLRTTSTEAALPPNARIKRTRNLPPGPRGWYADSEPADKGFWP